MNINAILVLLLSKINLIEERFRILNNIVSSIPERLNESGKSNLARTLRDYGVNREFQDMGNQTKGIENSNATHDHAGKRNDELKISRSDNIENNTRYGGRSNRFRNAVRKVTAAHVLTDTSETNEDSIIDHSKGLLRQTGYAGTNDMSQGLNRNYANSNDDFENEHDERSNDLPNSKDVHIFQVQPYEETHELNERSLGGNNEYDGAAEENLKSHYDVNTFVDSDSIIGTKALRRLHNRIKYGDSNDSGNSQIVVRGRDVDNLRMSQDGMEEVHREILVTLENVVKIHFDICEVRYEKQS